MEEGTEELLGDPRLKNGLAYYPAVMTPQGVVCLGNIVRLSLLTEDGHSYVAYGHLKGLWLWRDQPYMRLQYLAPVRSDAAADEIAYRAEEPSDPPQLLVTNQVADLHMSALRGPVHISSGGSMSKQLFQHNIPPSAERFSCTRHLDVAAQRVQPLDASFRLTPLVVPFTAPALKTIAGPAQAAPAAAKKAAPAARPAPAGRPAPAASATVLYPLVGDTRNT